MNVAHATSSQAKRAALFALRKWMPTTNRSERTRRNHPMADAAQVVCVLIAVVMLRTIYHLWFRR